MTIQSACSHFRRLELPYILLAQCLCLLASPLATNLNAQSTDEPTKPVTVKVMSYNIHHGRGMDQKIDLSRIAKIIEREQPDLVALQEVDFNTQRSNEVDQATELAKLTGMQSHFFRQIDFEGGEYGQAILSKYPISDPQIHWLPGKPDRERRIAAIATITLTDASLSSLPSGKIGFGSTHLHHANADFRLAQARELIAVATKYPFPVIIAGDYNARPDSQPMLELGEKAHITTHENSVGTPHNVRYATFPSVAPENQIDYIIGFTSDKSPIIKFHTTESQVVEEPMASDHRPLISTIELHRGYYEQSNSCGLKTLAYPKPSQPKQPPPPTHLNFCDAEMPPNGFS